MQASRVLGTWSHGIARGSITHIAQNRLYNELLATRTDQPFRVLPGEQQKDKAK